MQQFLIVLFGLSLIVFVGCSNETSSMVGYKVGGIVLGDSYKKVIEEYGNPSEEEKVEGFSTLTYKENDQLVMVLKFKDKKVQSIDAYPFNAKEKLVSNMEELIEKNGEPDKVEQAQCYHTAECERYIYESNKQKLEIQFNYDKKIIDRVQLFYKD